MSHTRKRSILYTKWSYFKSTIMLIGWKHSHPVCDTYTAVFLTNSCSPSPPNNAFSARDMRRYATLAHSATRSSWLHKPVFCMHKSWKCEVVDSVSRTIMKGNEFADAVSDQIIRSELRIIPLGNCDLFLDC